MTTPDPAKLTRLQYAALKIYRRYDTEGFTIRQILKVTGSQWLLMISFSVFFYFYLVPAGLTSVGCSLGFSVGRSFETSVTTKLPSESGQLRGRSLISNELRS